MPQRLKYIKEKTNGRFTITRFYAGEIIPPEEMITGVGAGLAEMGEGSGPYWAGMERVMDLSFGLPGTGRKPPGDVWAFQNGSKWSQMLAGPIYVPIIKMLGFDTLWFGILFILNMSQAYLTPPYGFNLFYLRGLTPFIKENTGVEITMLDLYRGVMPFVGLKLLNLILVMVFPKLVLWLPTLIYG